MASSLTKKQKLKVRHKVGGDVTYIPHKNRPCHFCLQKEQQCTCTFQVISRQARYYTGHKYEKFYFLWHDFHKSSRYIKTIIDQVFRCTTLTHLKNLYKNSDSAISMRAMIWGFPTELCTSTDKLIVPAASQCSETLLWVWCHK